MGPLKHLQSRPPNRSTENDFASAARKRWADLGEELRTDVTEFNARQGSVDFFQDRTDRIRVNNARSGLELVVAADFEARIIRYDYQQVSAKSAGVPEGGILAMRQTPSGAVEFYSADRQLTSQETRETLLQPLLPPQMAA